MSSSFNSSVAVAVLAALVAATPGTSGAASTAERLDSLERKLESRGLIDMLNRIEQLQRDVQQLRGNLEVQAHTLDDLQRRQREQYLDIDRRLQQLETGQAGAAPAGGVAPAVPPLVPPPVSSQPPAVPPVMMPPVSSQPPARPPDVPAPTAADIASEQAEYETALAILREGRYAEATQAFNRFLAAYPQSSYADNANYWLGETYYVTRDFDRALQTFAGLIGNYPQSSKVSDSQLKLGYIYYEKQDWAAARRELEAVVNNYPGSTTARLASDRLQRMKKEGR